MSVLEIAGYVSASWASGFGIGWLVYMLRRAADAA